MDGFHTFLPIPEKVRIQTSEQLACLRHRLLNLQTAGESVQRHLSEIEECKELIKGRCEDVAKMLKLYEKQAIEDLEHLKQVLTANLPVLLQDVKMHIMDSAYAPPDVLGSYLCAQLSCAEVTRSQLFQFKCNEPIWDFESLLGITWKNGLESCSNKAGYNELYEIEEGADCERYLTSCFAKLKLMLPENEARVRMSTMTPTLKLNFYEENYHGLLARYLALEQVKADLTEDENQVLCVAQKCFTETCKSKSQTVIAGHSTALATTIRSLIHCMQEKSSRVPDSDSQILEPTVDAVPMDTSEERQEVQSVPSLSIPVIVPGGLNFFNCTDHTYSSANLPEWVSFDDCSALTYKDNGNLFMCGGGKSVNPPWVVAYEISCSSTGVEYLPPMLSPRRFHGVIAHLEDVYVFGGSDGRNLNSCEKFSRMKWEAIDSMHTKRRCFNPAKYQDQVYILGGEKTSSAEMFRISSQQFFLLPIKLPETGHCSALVYKEGLVVITRTRILHWDIDNLQTQPKDQGGVRIHPWSNMSAMCCGASAYFQLHHCGTCIPGNPLKVLDLETYRITSVLPA